MAFTVIELTPKIFMKNIGTVAVWVTRTAFADVLGLAFPEESLVHPEVVLLSALMHGVVTTAVPAPGTGFSPAYVVATLDAEFAPVLYNPAADAPDNAAAFTETCSLLCSTYTWPRSSDIPVRPSMAVNERPIHTADCPR
jgi:hypothetical protein